MDPFHELFVPAEDEGVAVECWDEGAAGCEEIFGDFGGGQVTGVEAAEGADAEAGELFDGEICEEALGELVQELRDLEEHGGVCHLLEYPAEDNGLIADAEGVAVTGADTSQGEGTLTVEGLDAGWEITQRAAGHRDGQVNLDPADGIDQFDKGFEIDHAIMVDGDAEVILDGFGKAAGTAAGTGIMVHPRGAEEVGLVDLEGVRD